MKSKSWLALLCGVIVSVLFSGCVPVTSTRPVALTAAPAATKEPVGTRSTVSPAQKSEMRLLTWLNPGGAEQSVYQRCGVKYEVVGQGEYGVRLRAMIASGAAPDLVLVSTASITSIAREGLLAEIKDTSGVKLGDFISPLVAAFSFQGQLYAVPRDFTTMALFFNKDLFAKLGLKYPTDDWTWNDLRDAADIITSKMGVPGFYAPEYAWNFAPFVVQSGGRIVTPDFSDTLIASPEAITAGNFVAEGWNKGWAITQEKLGLGWYDAFGAEKVAMVLGDYGYISYLAAKYPKLNYGVAHPPAGPKSEGTWLYSTAYAVPAKAPTWQASFDAIACLTSEASQSQILESGQALPSRQSLEKHAYLQKHLAANTIFTGIYLPTIPYNWGPQHSMVEEIVAQALKQVYYEHVPVDKSFYQAAGEISKLLKQ